MPRAPSAPMTPEDLKERTTAFAVDIVQFCKNVRDRTEGRDIAQQLSDSATAVASNYRAACRARSRREFIAKLGVASRKLTKRWAGWKLPFGAVSADRMPETDSSRKLASCWRSWSRRARQRKKRPGQEVRWRAGTRFPACPIDNFQFSINFQSTIVNLQCQRPAIALSPVAKRATAAIPPA
jgi:hypothetical protein